MTNQYGETQTVLEEIKQTLYSLPFSPDVTASFAVPLVTNTIDAAVRIAVLDEQIESIRERRVPRFGQLTLYQNVGALLRQHAQGESYHATLVRACYAGLVAAQPLAAVDVR